MNNNIKINYLKHWGNDGTTYNQTITIDLKTAFDFNKYINRLKENTKKEIAKNNYIINCEQLKILDYLEPLQFTINYTNLTTLDYFMKFYLHTIYEPPKKDKTYERILWRNTIIKINTKGAILWN